MARQLAEGDKAGLAQSYGQAVRLLVILAAPAAAAATFYADWAVGLVYGAEYQPAGAVLMILGWGWVLFFINAPIGNILAASNLMPKFVPWAAANIGLNVVLNLVLIPVYGALGAASATLICETTSLVIQLVFGRRVLGFWPPLAGQLWRPGLAGAAMLALLFTTGKMLHPLAGLALGLVVYGAVLIACRGLTGADLSLLRAVAARWAGRDIG